MVLQLFELCCEPCGTLCYIFTHRKADSSISSMVACYTKCALQQQNEHMHNFAEARHTRSVVVAEVFVLRRNIARIAAVDLIVRVFVALLR